MNDFLIYFNLGLTHVLDWNAYDHVLFLSVLVAAFGFKDFKPVIALVTLFTLGHTLSLVLAAYDWVSLSSRVIEFLIPVSILVTAIYRLFTAGKNVKSGKTLLYAITLFFGLVHGFGFSSFFLSTTGSSGVDFGRLFAFAVGIEAAQLIVVLVVLLLSLVFQSLLRFSKRDWVLFIAALVIGLSIPLLRANWIL
ncbi:HupE/UreJ family protein [Mesonia sp. HuA40]|uniref:HupE/UreJ family protein n=1 Tax=Mesonia sp. HuA40 TaxID=2602761 RepID=UPI0011C89E5D|nr:HupE/UreJ family protein [Mesonia sp. HuA40]TXK72738.1 HupE/UreJ family protein [Mesonia sp. HuA40]